MNDIRDVLQELAKFSEDIVDVGLNLIEQDVIDFENKYNLILPDDFKIFLSKYNGFFLMGSKILGFNRDGNSIDTIYFNEHELVELPQYEYLVPFCNDGGGNFYCLDTRECKLIAEKCKIVFWQSDYEYTDVDQPEITHESFSDFVKEVFISWKLKYYNYDGSEK